MTDRIEASVNTSRRDGTDAIVAETTATTLATGADLIPAALRRALSSHASLAVAVSGGVDSLTLAWAAAQVLGPALQVMHAAGPAVPPSATQRVRQYADQAGWQLQILNAGEYDDPAYRSNPVNRCYFCKNNLYDRIRAATNAPIAAGTNLDDLGEYRPGLTAAGEHGVLHPYVEAAMDKSAVRALAASFGLNDIAVLPAQPCLASRVETGIPIDAADLAFIDQVEITVATHLGAGDIRCRITAVGVWLELSPTLVGAGGKSAQSVEQLMQTLCADAGRVFAGRRSYQRGSAFLVEQIEQQTVIQVTRR